eukprot:jgi/Psemu1/321556/estExt_fgenesh1_pg.C_50013
MTEVEDQNKKEASAMPLNTSSMKNEQNVQEQDKRDCDRQRETNPNTNANTNAHRKKRKRYTVNTLEEAYSTVSFSPRKPSDTPDSPSFFFPSSYDFTFPGSKVDDERKNADGPSANNGGVDLRQVVHHHVNGLCMVTAGELSIPPTKVLKFIRFLAKEAPPCSNAAKRKRQAQMLRGRGKAGQPGVVHPSTVIAEMILEDKVDGDRPGAEDAMNVENRKTTIVPIRACVWGTILELNSTALTPQVLLNDPLLDGYIAIILPSGRFPPPATEVASPNE